MPNLTDEEKKLQSQATRDAAGCARLMMIKDV
jgi:hypothetical protein